MNSVTYNTDCLAAMREMPDKAFDLAIVDPPYGIGHFTQSDRVDKYGDYKWNSAPPNAEYFIELTRVSKRRIIWGANYYNCFEGEMGAIVWNKQNPHPSMSRCEIASVSWGKRVGYFEYGYTNVINYEDRFHPCQKPYALYHWTLTNYAKQGDTILDTHLGSGSSRIAAYDLGFDFTGYELDSDYFNAQEERFARHIAQPQLFEIPRAEPIQEVMFAAA